jgi:hypothetical protein
VLLEGLDEDYHAALTTQAQPEAGNPVSTKLSPRRAASDKLGAGGWPAMVITYRSPTYRSPD